MAAATEEQEQHQDTAPAPETSAVGTGPKVVEPAGRLKGKVALITGGTRGIGLSIAKAFVREGAKVVIAGKTPRHVKDALEELKEMGATATGAKVNLNSLQSAESLYTAAIRAYGKVDVLVNNAALLGPPRLGLDQYPVAEWDSVMRTNVDALYYLTRAVLGSMIPGNGGSIINVTSGVAKKGRAGWGAYSVSKAAVDNLTEVLAEDVQKYDVRVNAVNPGATRTEMRATAAPNEDPMTLPHPDDIMNAFIYLASDVSKGVTGSIFQAKDWVGRSF